MRKTTKGAMAVGAGVALLLGGAGTLAAWQTSLPVADQAVASGDLNLTATGTATWVWGTAASATTCTVPTTPIAFVPGTSKLVPGDCVVYTQPITVTAIGDNLRSNIAVTGTPTFGTVGELSSKLNVSSAATFTIGTGITAGTVAGTYDFNSAVATNKTISAAGTVKVTVIFDPATTGRVGAAQSTTITGVGLLLKQTAPAAA